MPIYIESKGEGVKRPDENPECPICGNDTGTANEDGTIELAILLPCGHCFGHLCIAQWLSSRSSDGRPNRACPFERAEIPVVLRRAIIRMQEPVVSLPPPLSSTAVIVNLPLAHARHIIGDRTTDELPSLLRLFHRFEPLYHTIQRIPLEAVRYFIDGEDPLHLNDREDPLTIHVGTLYSLYTFEEREEMVQLSLHYRTNVQASNDENTARITLGELIGAMRLARTSENVRAYILAIYTAETTQQFVDIALRATHRGLRPAAWAEDNDEFGAGIFDNSELGRRTDAAEDVEDFLDDLLPMDSLRASFAAPDARDHGSMAGEAVSTLANASGQLLSDQNVVQGEQSVELATAALTTDLVSSLEPSDATHGAEIADSPANAISGLTNESIIDRLREAQVPPTPFTPEPGEAAGRMAIVYAFPRNLITSTAERLRDHQDSISSEELNLRRLFSPDEIIALAERVRNYDAIVAAADQLDPQASLYEQVLRQFKTWVEQFGVNVFAEGFQVDENSIGDAFAHILAPLALAWQRNLVFNGDTTITHGASYFGEVVPDGNHLDAQAIETARRLLLRTPVRRFIQVQGDADPVEERGSLTVSESEVDIAWLRTHYHLVERQEIARLLNFMHNSEHPLDLDAPVEAAVIDDFGADEPLAPYQSRLREVLYRSVYRRGQPQSIEEAEIETISAQAEPQSEI